VSGDFAPDYVEVAERLGIFRDKYPEGSLQPADPAAPYSVLTVGDQTYLVVVAAAYRTADDPRPGIGMAQELIPGRTPYTKGSELQNAETSAWGRAIVAVLAADTKRGIASADEVRGRESFGDDPLHVMRNKLLAAATEQGWDMERLSKEFHAWSAGGEIREADLDTLTRYQKVLVPPKTAQRKPLDP
jgi:hypothetical protein